MVLKTIDHRHLASLATCIKISYNRMSLVMKHIQDSCDVAKHIRYGGIFPWYLTYYLFHIAKFPARHFHRTSMAVNRVDVDMTENRVLSAQQVIEARVSFDFQDKLELSPMLAISGFAFLQVEQIIWRGREKLDRKISWAPMIGFSWKDSSQIIKNLSRRTCPWSTTQQFMMVHAAAMQAYSQPV